MPTTVLTARDDENTQNDEKVRVRILGPPYLVLAIRTRYIRTRYPVVLRLPSIFVVPVETTKELFLGREMRNEQRWRGVRTTQHSEKAPCEKKNVLRTSIQSKSAKIVSHPIKILTASIVYAL